MWFYCWKYCRVKPPLFDGEQSKLSIPLLAISLEIIMINHKGTKQKERKRHSDFLLVASHGEAKEGCRPGWILVNYQLTVGLTAIRNWLRNKCRFNTGKETKVPTYKETKKDE